MKRVYAVDSREWYQDGGQAEAYLKLMDTSYSGDIVEGEDVLLSTLEEKLIETIPAPFSYVDLGPGDGRKTQRLVSALKKRNLLSEYCAVDIQPRYVSHALDIVKAMGLPVSSFVGSFDTFLQQHSSEAFFYLGATCGNLDEKFDELLAQSSGWVYLSCALFPENKEALVKGYENALDMFIPLAKRKGISVEKPCVFFNEEMHQIELGFIEGDTYHILGVSKKPTLQKFKERITKNFEGDFFANAQHVGFLGCSKVGTT